MKILMSTLALSLLAQIASAQTVNLYTPSGKNAGYARVNPKTGSVDIYDSGGKRLGYGKIQGKGNIELYKPNSERLLTGKPAAGTGTRSKPAARPVSRPAHPW